MSDRTNRVSICTKNHDRATLEAENKRLIHENQRLTHQAEDVAKANAHAAELMVKLEQANKNLNAEIKKRKRIEKELRKHRENLEDLIEEHTIELRQTNKELEQEITERKKAEQALQKLNKDLESAVKELSRTNKELKDFIHIASHDLKTPLRGIGTLAEWIATDCADKLDEQGKEQVKLLTTRAERIIRLIDSMLEYSDITRKRRNEKTEDLNTLLIEVIREISPPENIQITIENQLPILLCEKAHLIQVFQNLLSNAIKYIDKPQGQIKIGCVEENGFWKFSVFDNGPGIERPHFEKIFQIFQTLSLRDEFESTGIGLTMAKKIVELYEGKIWVESKVGEGSTFYFTLPQQDMGGKNEKLQADITCRS